MLLLVFLTAEIHQEVDRNRAERNLVASKMKGKKEPEEARRLIEQGLSLKRLGEPCVYVYHGSFFEVSLWDFV